MEEMPVTIHGSKALVLGFGRVGKTLAKMLDGIGAKTFVAVESILILHGLKAMDIMPYH